MQRTVYICDQCRKAIDEPIQVRWFAWGLEGASERRGDFCSWRCATKYTARYGGIEE